MGSNPRQIATMAEHPEKDKNTAVSGTTPSAEKKRKICCTKPGVLFLPWDIMANILSRLPFKSLLRFCCVCKHWQTLLHDPCFTNEYLTKEFVESQMLMVMGTEIYTSATIWLYNFASSAVIQQCCLSTIFREKTRSSSCAKYKLTNSVNGLVIVSRVLGLKPYLYLLNPVTKDFIGVPRARMNFEDRISSLDMGFGFCDSTEEYKLVNLHHKKINNYKLCVCEVLTLGSQVWRYVDDALCRVLSSSPVFLNGVLYWLAYAFDRSSFVILKFDIKDEKLGFISIPQTILSKDITVRMLEGHICLVEEPKHSIEKDFITRIWMQRDYANHEWEAKYSFNLLNLLNCRYQHQDLGIYIIDIKDGKMLMRRNDIICSYDLYRGTLDILHRREGLKHKKLNVMVGSLVSPRNLFRNSLSRDIIMNK